MRRRTHRRQVCWFTPQMAGAGLSRGQRPGAYPRALPWVAGTQLQTPPVCSSGKLESGPGARNQTYTLPYRTQAALPVSQPLASIRAVSGAAARPVPPALTSFWTPGAPGLDFSGTFCLPARVPVLSACFVTPAGVCTIGGGGCLFSQLLKLQEASAFNVRPGCASRWLWLL